MAISVVAVGVPAIAAAIVLPLLSGNSDAASVNSSEDSAAMPAASGQVQALTVTASSCGAGWSLSSTGAAAFAIANKSGKSAEITLRSTADEGIIAEIEGMPPRVTRQLSTVVNPGTYYWLCQFRDSTSARSQVVTVTGPQVAVAEPLLEVGSDDMDAPVKAYKAYVAGQLALLKTQTEALQKDLTAGDAAKAKADWLTAHLTYHRVGAAYDAFGDDGEGVDGLAQGLPGGSADPDFRGFHKIEQLLWSGAAPAGIVPQATALTAAVGVLATKLPSFTFDPNDISLRTHEILEGTARFQLTGADDYGSGTSLATADADIDGTRTLVTILAPLLEARSKGLPDQLTSQLTTLQRAIEATRSGGQWTAVKNITLAQRHPIDAGTGAVLEALSVVPDMLEIRN